MVANQDRIPEYKAWAERDREAVTDQSTAKELAILTFRASRNVYYFADADYQQESLGRIRRQAEALAAAAATLSDHDEVTRYRVVADMAQEFEDRVTPDQEVRIAPEETRLAYDDLLTKNGTGILTPETDVTIHKRISKAVTLGQKLSGWLHTLNEPGADVEYIRGLLAKLDVATTQALEAYETEQEIEQVVAVAILESVEQAH